MYVHVCTCIYTCIPNIIIISASIFFILIMPLAKSFPCLQRWFIQASLWLVPYQDRKRVVFPFMALM